MSAKIGDRQMCSVSPSTVSTALLLLLLVLSTLLVAGCSRNRKPSARTQDGVYKTATGDVYFQCGGRRTYLGKAVVHEPEEGPSTKDHLRPHQFGTEIIPEGPKDLSKRHRD